MHHQRLLPPLEVGTLLAAQKMRGALAHTVETSRGALTVHEWAPPAAPLYNLTVVTVHPWAPLGGSEYNTAGLGSALAQAGLRALTFNLRSSFMVWGVLVNHRSEIDQVSDVAAWAAEKWGTKVLLLGSSAGAPQAGSALDRHESIVGLACVGYTFGSVASIAFGRHFSALVRSTKPRLLIMGSEDEFTSEAQLATIVSRSERYGPCESEIVRGVGHFALESPQYDEWIARRVIQWFSQLEVATTCPGSADRLRRQAERNLA